MQRVDGRSSAWMGTAVVLSASSAAVGWSASVGSEVGMGIALVAITVTLATSALRQSPLGVPAATRSAPSRSGWQELQRELDRSRRHGHPFVLIRVDGRLAGPRMRDAPDRGHPEGPLDSALSPFLRSADSLWTVERDVYILLPESTRAMGQRFVERVEGSRTGLSGCARIVAFPEDGVTGGALVDLLRGRTVARHSIPKRAEPVGLHETS